MTNVSERLIISNFKNFKSELVHLFLPALDTYVIQGG